MLRPKYFPIFRSANKGKQREEFEESNVRASSVVVRDLAVEEEGESELDDE